MAPKLTTTRSTKCAVSIFLVFSFLGFFSACRKTSTPTAAGAQLQIKGSDTMVHLVTLWAESFKAMNPDVALSVTGGGSGTGISALLDGRTELCMSSRPLEAKEYELAKSHGITIKEHIVARDGVALAVHPDNPVQELSLPQLKDIFQGKAKSWDLFGGQKRPILPLSRESNSGTYVYFIEHVLNKEDFAPSVRLMAASSAIVHAVQTDRAAIGYVGLGYAREGGIRILKLKKTDADPAIAPTNESVLSGTYPLSRPLYLYTKGEPQGSLAAFLRYCLSTDGQKVVDKAGFVSVSNEGS